MTSLDCTNPLHARFLAEFEQPAQNFENDAELKPDDKSRFIIHLNGFKKGNLDFHLKNDFCYKTKNQQLGKTAALKPEEKVGHVRALGAFARHIKESSGTDIVSADVETFVRSLSLLEPKKLVTRLGRLMGVDAKLSHRMMWSFRNPKEPASPTAISNTSALPRRLGLMSSLNGVPHVLVGYAIGDSGAHLPTFFDSALNTQWRPGGKTLPYPEPDATVTDGLPELVHGPVSINQITTQLLVL